MTTHGYMTKFVTRSISSAARVLFKMSILMYLISFRVRREAEANKLKLTPQLLELKFIMGTRYNRIWFWIRGCWGTLKVSREVPKNLSEQMSSEANVEDGEASNPEVKQA